MYDLVGSCFPPIFKAFAEACPYVETSLMCGTSPELSKALGSGTLDLAVIEAITEEAAGECLRVERLVWVGARGGGAHRKRPLPISMVAESCAFRPAVQRHERLRSMCVLVFCDGFEPVSVVREASPLCFLWYAKRPRFASFCVYEVHRM